MCTVCAVSGELLLAGCTHIHIIMHDEVQHMKLAWHERHWRCWSAYVLLLVCGELCLQSRACTVLVVETHEPLANLRRQARLLLQSQLAALVWLQLG
jgi:hypothetical protein